MSTFRDWIPAEEKKGSEGNGFTDFVPGEEVKETKKPNKISEKLSEEDIADLGVDISKLESLENDK